MVRKPALGLEGTVWRKINGYNGKNTAKRKWNSEEEMQTKNLELFLRYYRKFFADEDEDIAVELMQAYTDRFEYQKASYWMQKKEQMEYTHKQKNPGMTAVQLS